jgi:hypothetical protein
MGAGDPGGKHKAGVNPTDPPGLPSTLQTSQLANGCQYPPRRGVSRPDADVMKPDDGRGRRDVKLSKIHTPQMARRLPRKSPVSGQLLEVQR